ncbi:hypothetical protein [Acinetobacter terrae]|uniref:Heme exporter protein D n=1 Tax=Acinetobacter terrae TaxID=2731247 RepID=A0ABX1V6E5_9GAMM|nr:hypothetical protein [Acinetobacter terrae]NNH88206.1 hypothetical protein [Acinetobacter terrae]
MHELNYGHIAVLFFIVVPCVLIVVMLFKLLMNEAQKINKKAAALKNKIESENR